MPRGATSGIVKRYIRRDTPCIRERRVSLAGGLAGAALPAGFKGAGPFGRAWGAAPTNTIHGCYHVVQMRAKQWDLHQSQLRSPAPTLERSLGVLFSVRVGRHPDTPGSGAAP